MLTVCVVFFLFSVSLKTYYCAVRSAQFYMDLRFTSFIIIIIMIIIIVIIMHIVHVFSPRRHSRLRYHLVDCHVDLNPNPVFDLGYLGDLTSWISLKVAHAACRHFSRQTALFSLQALTFEAGHYRWFKRPICNGTNNQLAVRTLFNPSTKLKEQERVDKNSTKPYAKF